MVEEGMKQTTTNGGPVTTSIGELNLMTETEARYRCNERLEDFHASNYDWQRVIQDKWHLLIWQGGSL